MPFWNGYSFDRPTFDAGTQAGIAGAVSNLGGVSGTEWKGFQPWLSALVAGLYGGRDKYLANAFEVQQKLDEGKTQDIYRKAQEENLLAQADQRRQAAAQETAMTNYLLSTTDPRDLKGLDVAALGSAQVAGILKQRAEDRKNSVLDEQWNATMRRAGMEPSGDRKWDEKRMEAWLEAQQPKKPTPMTEYELYQKGRTETNDQSALDAASFVYEHALTPEEHQLVAPPWDGGTLDDYQKVIAARAKKVDIGTPPASLIGGDATGNPQYDKIIAESRARTIGALLLDRGAPGAPGAPAPSVSRTEARAASAERKTVVAESAQSGGLVPRQSATFPAKGSMPTNGPEPKVTTKQNPAVMPDEQVKLILSKLPGLPAGVADNPQAVAVLKSEISRLVSAGMPPDLAAKTAVQRFMQAGVASGKIVLPGQ